MGAMFAVLLVLLIAVPFLELWVIVEVWQAVGGWWTIVALLAISVAGAWLVKREGTGVWFRLNRQIEQGKVPHNEVIDGALILFAGALMLTPGFLTDIVGLALLLPPTRAGVRAVVRRLLFGWVERTARAGGAVRYVVWGSRRARAAQTWRRPGQAGDIIDVAAVDLHADGVGNHRDGSDPVAPSRALAREVDR
jgi:UPF0716 protein FxsA